MTKACSARPPGWLPEGRNGIGRNRQTRPLVAEPGQGQRAVSNRRIQEAEVATGFSPRLTSPSTPQQQVLLSINPTLSRDTTSPSLPFYRRSGPLFTHQSMAPFLIQKWQRHPLVCSMDGSTVGRLSQSRATRQRGDLLGDRFSMIFSPQLPGQRKQIHFSTHPSRTITSQCCPPIAGCSVAVRSLA